MAETPEGVTHGFTLRSPWFTSAILRGIKSVENRCVTFPAGWYAIHTGVAKHADQSAHEHVRSAASAAEYAIVSEDVASLRVVKGTIAGVCFISHSLPARCIVDHVDGVTCPSAWALGPFCMVVSRVIWLSEPIACAGNLGNWPLSQDNRTLLVARLQSVKATDAAERYPRNDTELDKLRKELRESKRAQKRTRD